DKNFVPYLCICSSCLAVIRWTPLRWCP
ncbi:binding--dependent transport system inner membrane component family protein, partial [Vibrio parahaemolyticus VP2007-007]